MTSEPDVLFMLGRGCSTAVEHLPPDREVEGSIPAGAGAGAGAELVFFLFPMLPDVSITINHKASLIRSLKELLHHLEMM